MQLLKDYFAAVEAAVYAAAKGEDVQTELEALHPMQSELAEYCARQAASVHSLEKEITANPHLQNARRTKAMKAELRRNEQIFILSWAGGGTQQVKGWCALKQQLDLAESTIRTKLSLGRETFRLEFNNPLTGEPDILTVTRLPQPELAEPTRQKKRRGRPRKHFADHERLGIEFAPPAKIMPKERNRRTDEKQ